MEHVDGVDTLWLGSLVGVMSFDSAIAESDVLEVAEFGLFFDFEEKVIFV